MIEITTNNQERPLLSFYDLPTKDQSYYSSLLLSPEDHTFFKYRNDYYLLSNFIRTEGIEAFRGWDAFGSDSFFSGVLIKLTESNSLIAATYISKSSNS